MGLIVPQVHNKDHLLALSKVSKRCRSYVFPRLFEVLTVKPYDEDSLWDLGSYPFFAEAMIAKVPNVLAAVKELCLSAPFRKEGLGVRTYEEMPAFALLRSGFYYIFN